LVAQKQAIEDFLRNNQHKKFQHSAAQKSAMARTASYRLAGEMA